MCAYGRRRGGGMKAINIQRLGEREEGGQRGTEDGILLLCVLHPVFLYHSTTCLFILFIYLSFFMFSQSPSHLVWTPHPFHTTPPPPYQTPLQQLSNALFWPLRCYLLLLLMLGVPPTDNTHTQTYTHTHTDSVFLFAFLKSSSCS